jgi:hypothetical protein
MIVPELTNYIQMCLGSVSYFFLVFAKWCKYTHIKALQQVCSFIKPLLQNSHPLHPNYFIKKTLLKNISSVISMVEFTDICEFCFSILASADPQKSSLVWYTLKHGVAQNLMLHSRHLNFVVVSLFLTEHTPHQILLHCISHCLLCLVSCLFSWLVEGDCFPALVVKTLTGEGCLMIQGSSVCHNALEPL